MISSKEILCDGSDTSKHREGVERKKKVLKRRAFFYIKVLKLKKAVLKSKKNDMYGRRGPSKVQVATT